MNVKNKIEELGLVLTTYKNIRISEKFYYNAYNILESFESFLPYVKALNGSGYTAIRMESSYSTKSKGFCYFNDTSKVWAKKRIVIVI